MQGSWNLPLDAQQRPLRASVCVLLALLILYNPFLAFISSYGSFSVHGLARHRATVGASELQHLGCTQDQTQQGAASFKEFRDEFAGPAAEYEEVTLRRDVELPQPESVSRVWSRPPPLA